MQLLDSKFVFLISGYRYKVNLPCLQWQTLCKQKEMASDVMNFSKQVLYSLLKIYNSLHFLKRMLQVVDNAVFWQNVLLYFENDSLSPSF